MFTSILFPINKELYITFTNKELKKVFTSISPPTNNYVYQYIGPTNKER